MERRHQTWEDKRARSITDSSITCSRVRVLVRIRSRPRLPCSDLGRHEANPSRSGRQAASNGRAAAQGWGGKEGVFDRTRPATDDANRMDAKNRFAGGVSFARSGRAR